MENLKSMESETLGVIHLKPQTDLSCPLEPALPDENTLFITNIGEKVCQDALITLAKPFGRVMACRLQ